MSDPFRGYRSAYPYESKSDGDAIDGELDCWILGRLFDSKHELRKRVKREIKTKLWFTYRKNFRAIGGTGPTSDAGWGCTMRCGQMLLAQALTWRHLGRDWEWKQKVENPVYNQILSHFLDQPDALYSIQQITQCGVDFNRRIGEWFGPNNVCHVIRKLSQFDDWSSLSVQVAMDMTVIIEEIKDSCYERESMLASSSLSTASSSSSSSSSSQSRTFHPLLLFIPLRPGQDRIHDKYREALKACFRMPQCLGMIGGRPKHALWFFGYQGDRLLCLDPHTVQPALNPEKRSAIPDETYHSSSAILIPINDLDPSIALGFFCRDEADVNDMFDRLQKHVVNREPPLFEIFPKRPRNMPPLVDPRPSRSSDQRVEESFTDLSLEAEAAAAMNGGGLDEDEDYDIIDPMELGGIN
ncbi:cysteine protease ATG4A-like [Oscarella lobularis]|uniref:cysteine protease ATG4A-like n=1 Tax=Oscarella lobularis TaxID=121494 RepID=UPI0033132ECB